MKKVTIIITILMLSFITSNAQISSLGQAINKAGMQRYLTRRMAKDYIALGAGIQVDEAQKELKESATLFEKNYNDLVLYANSKEINEALAKLDVLWTQYKVRVTTTPVRTAAPSIITESNKIFNVCNEIVGKLVESSGVKTASLSDISGKQREYTQRIAMIYFAKIWNVEYNNLDIELSSSVSGFETGLKTLTNTPENTEEINMYLKLQKQNWDFQKEVLFNTKKSLPTSIFSGTNLILNNAMKLTEFYSQLVTKQ